MDLNAARDLLDTTERIFRRIAAMSYVGSSQTARGSESGRAQCLRDSETAESSLHIGSGGLVYLSHPGSKVMHCAFACCGNSIDAVEHALAMRGGFVLDRSGGLGEGERGEKRRGKGSRVRGRREKEEEEREGK